MSSEDPMKRAKANADRVLKAGPWPRIFFGVKGDGTAAAQELPRGA